MCAWGGTGKAREGGLEHGGRLQSFKWREIKQMVEHLVSTEGGQQQ